MLGVRGAGGRGESSLDRHQHILTWFESYVLMPITTVHEYRRRIPHQPNCRSRLCRDLCIYIERVLADTDPGRTPRKTRIPGRAHSVRWRDSRFAWFCGVCASAASGRAVVPIMRRLCSEAGVALHDKKTLVKASTACGKSSSQVFHFRTAFRWPNLRYAGRRRARRQGRHRGGARLCDGKGCAGRVDRPRQDDRRGRRPRAKGGGKAQAARLTRRRLTGARAVARAVAQHCFSLAAGAGRAHALLDTLIRSTLDSGLTT